MKILLKLKKAFPKKDIPPAPPKHALLRINSSRLLLEEVGIQIQLFCCLKGRVWIDLLYLFLIYFQVEVYKFYNLVTWLFIGSRWSLCWNTNFKSIAFVDIIFIFSDLGPQQKSLNFFDWIGRSFFANAKCFTKETSLLHRYLRQN